MLGNSLRQKIKKKLPQPIKSLLLSIKYRGMKLPEYKIYQSYLKDKRGLEVGGPSTIFETILPIYQVVESLDGVNFASNTVWEGAISAGGVYSYYGRKNGTQYVADATNLSGIKSREYDFILSSNCLEHVANPLKAVKEWKRVLRPGGMFVLILPKKESNFDHKRPITKFEHLLDDYNRNRAEDDLTHLEEILALHDLSRDPPAGDFETFKKRSLDNFNNRTLHHHVFDGDLMRKVFEHCGFEVINTGTTKTDFFGLALNRDGCGLVGQMPVDND